MRLDIVSRTVGLLFISVWLVTMTATPFLACLFLAGIFAAVVVRTSLALVIVAVLAPTMPIGLSHLVFQPMISTSHIGDAGDATNAVIAWLRVSGLAVWSIAWLGTIRIEDGASLAKASLLGQYVFLPFLVASTFTSVARTRWIAIREVNALLRPGLLSKRRRVHFLDIPALALQLILISLVSSRELSLSCAGRGLGIKRKLPVAAPLPSASGVVLILALGLATWYGARDGFFRISP